MRKSLLAHGAALALVTVLSGCVSLLPKAKPAQLYRFGEQAGTGPANPSPTAPQARTGLVLGIIGFPRASTSDGILTVTGDQTAYIAGARWVAPARVLFQEALQREFQSGAQSLRLVEAGDVGPAGAVLRVDVSTFEVDYGPAEPVVLIILNARLSRGDGGVLDQREFKVTRPANANAVSAIVRAYDEATGEMMAELGRWTETEIAEAPPRPPLSTASPASPTPPSVSSSPLPGSIPPPPSVSSSSTSSTTTTTTQPHR